MGIKCLETAVYGACKRIEIFSSSLLENNTDTELQTKVNTKNFSLIFL